MKNTEDMSHGKDNAKKNVMKSFLLFKDKVLQNVLKKSPLISIQLLKRKLMQFLNFKII